VRAQERHVVVVARSDQQLGVEPSQRGVEDRTQPNVGRRLALVCHIA
jgi:hypothetical protein